MRTDLSKPAGLYRGEPLPPAPSPLVPRGEGENPAARPALSFRGSAAPHSSGSRTLRATEESTLRHLVTRRRAEQVRTQSAQADFVSLLRRIHSLCPAYRRDPARHLIAPAIR